MGSFFYGNQKFFSSIKFPPETIMKFRQDSQDDRVWALEVMLRHEGMLDPRIYDCASRLADAKKCTDREVVIAEWNKWKKTHKRDTYSQLNKL